MAGRIAAGALELLHEAPDLPRFDLPDELAAAYGGPLGFPPKRLYANFVASLDGVTAIPGLAHSSQAIAGGSATDRFVMGILRACADAVLVGAGTLRDAPGTTWTAEDAYGPAAGAYAELRRSLGRAPVPILAVVSGSGDLDPEHPGLARSAVVFTTGAGATRLRGRLPESVRLVPLAEEGPLDLRRVVEALRAEGHGLILTEGGPTLFASLVAAGLVDELFLTVSPLLAGRPAAAPRLSLLEGIGFLPEAQLRTQLLSLRRDGSLLFLRYALRAAE